MPSAAAMDADFSAAVAAPLSMLPWLSSFATRHFSCCACLRVTEDPVMARQSQRLLCRDCAGSDAEDVDDAPLPLRRAAAEVASSIAELGAHEGGSSGSKRYVRVNRAKHPTLGADAAARTLSPARRLEVEMTPPRGSADGIEGAAAQEDVGVLHASGFQGTCLNPNVSSDGRAASKQATPVRPPPPAPLSASRSAEAIARAIKELFAAERDGRSKITVDESLFTTDLRKKHTQQLRQIKGSRPNSSKQLKIRADDHYEKAEYFEAIDLYTRAIEANDGTSRIGVLYGNRSAANYMASRFDACVDDCLRVIELEPANAKICSRAVKAATGKGDLARAATLFDAVSPEHLTEEMRRERERIQTAAATLRKAEAHMGRPEGDEAWRMLVADFSDTVAFRIKYAESVAATHRFEKAAEILAQAVGLQRTADIAHAHAYYLYCSGFEHFEQAQVVLRPFSDDPKCRELLAIIVKTEEGKSSGNAAFSRRDFAQSIEDYTNAIGAARGNARVLRILYCNRAAGHKELGRYREGVEDCNKAIQLDPNFSKAFARRARCQQLLNDFAAAVHDFKEASRLDPGDTEVLRELKMAEAAQAKETERQKDYYYVLGVSKTATDRELKVKYRELSLKWHPDKCVNMAGTERAVAERKFKVISEAYQTLSDPLKRREYDLKADRERLSSMHRASTFNFASGFGSAFPSSYREFRQQTGAAAAGGGGSARYGASGPSSFW